MSVGSVTCPFTQFPDDVAGNLNEDSSSLNPSTKRALILSPDENEDDGIKAKLLLDAANK
jgi:hypothetical protein